MVQNKYDSYSGSSGGYDNIELKVNPFAEVRGNITSAFGSSHEGGQSLGVNFENVRLTDGGVYLQLESEKLKLFSWQEMAGLSPYEAAERNHDLTADDADEFLSKEYFGETYRYELMAAAVPAVANDDGDVVLSASSKGREYGWLDGEIEWHDFEDYGGDAVPIADQTVTWFGGTDDYGASASALSLMRTLTNGGESNVENEDDIYNWHSLDDGEDDIRSDIEGREVNFFVVTREGNNGYSYYAPVIEDVSTGQEIRPNNRSDDEADSGNDDSPDEDSSGATQSTEPDTYPEPVAEFLQSGAALNMNEGRAENLLDSLVEDPENELTEGMVADSGGREHLISEVV
jgi:hypothetical protein